MLDRRKFLIGSIAVAGTIASRGTIKIDHSDLPIHPPEVTRPKPTAVPVSTPTVGPHTEESPVEQIPKVRKHAGAKVKLSSYDRAVLVKTIWGETRGESNLGRMAVVHVILNRITTNNPLFKSYKSVSQVCLKKYQFSCWLDKWKMRHIKVDDTYKEIKSVVDDAVRLYESGDDYSNGALFYFSDIISPPKWASAYTLVNKIGLHNFLA